MIHLRLVKLGISVMTTYCEQSGPSPEQPSAGQKIGAVVKGHQSAKKSLTCSGKIRCHECAINIAIVTATVFANIA